MIVYKGFNFIQRLVFGIIVWAFFLSLTTQVNGETYGFTDSLLPIYIGTAWIAYILSDIHAYHHAVLIEKKNKDINHVFSFICRAIVAIVISLPVHHKTFQTLELAAVAGAVFFIAFDIRLNLIRGKEAFYVTNYYKSAFIDRIMRSWLKIGGKPDARLMLAVKVAVLIAVSVNYFL